jgi:hypothetical protein
MKTHIRLGKLLLLTSILFTTLQAQIPNPGFEDWTNSEPNGWFTTNSPPLIVNISQTSNSHSGNWAVKGEVIDFMFPIPPYLSTGSLTSPGFPISQKFNRISGYYQFSPVADDHFLVSATMGITTPSDTTIIGSGAIAIGDAVSEYTLFSFDIIYFLPGEPNWANIAISIIDTSCATPGHIGSTMLVDDLDIIVGVDDSEENLIVEEYMLRQNYPNPFNPVTKIKYQIAEINFATLKVYDVLGNEIVTLINEEKPAGNYEVEFDGSMLPSSIYFYQLKAENFLETKKMVLIK